MSDAARAYEDDVAARLKRHLDEHADVAEAIFGHPVERIELHADSDDNPPSAGFHVYLSDGAYKLVRIDVDAQSGGSNIGVAWSATTGTEPRFTRET